MMRNAHKIDPLPPQMNNNYSEQKLNEKPFYISERAKNIPNINTHNSIYYANPEQAQFLNKNTGRPAIE